MEIQEIKQKKAINDFVVASKIIGITPGNVKQALNRPGSKYHTAVVGALTRIITGREQLISESKPEVAA